MPPANSSALGARRAAPVRPASSRRPAPRRRSGARQVRWDRLARAAMLCVLAALLYLYLSAGVQMLSTWRQARRDASTVRSLALEHQRLAHERSILVKPETVELEARRLGMVKPGEQSYVISALPRG
jgi:hypothetical protein